MNRTMIQKIAGLAAVLCAAAALAAPPQPAPERVPAKLKDSAAVLSPADVQLGGWLGERVAVNEKNRLLVVDTVPLLAGYHQKPGSHPWIGEHIGKWLHAATLAWFNTGDPALKDKLDRTAAELISCQEPDGYLGTYVPEKRFGLFKGADWDVWSHKYNMIGLLTYYQYTGNEAALAACRKMGDLLIATFPAKRSIIAAGTHVGMAATSILEPVVRLYALTGEPRYLDFARYIVKSWDEEKGPKIIATLLKEKSVAKVANAKTYEMMSNLVGLCELARVTGDRNLLQPVEIAWRDIVARQRYITGAASYKEHFHNDFDLPNDPKSNVGECCVTTTWIQLNWQLLRLTGDARYGTELERSYYNHLAAAQHPRGDDWCYYTALEGKKPYAKVINCCHSSGPRAMALAPLTAYFKMTAGKDEALAVSTLETSKATLDLGGQRVTVEQQSGFPRQGKSLLTLHLAAPARFAVKVRVPEWTKAFKVKTGDVPAKNFAGWATLPAREWKDGDRIAIDFDLIPRLIAGTHSNAGRVAVAYGPFVLACAPSDNPGQPWALPLSAQGQPDCRPIENSKRLLFETRLSAQNGVGFTTVKMATFADAGADGGTYQVWLPAAVK